MESLIIFGSFAAILGCIALLGYGALVQFRRARDLLQFNVQGSNPMVRLIPNISFLLLFLMLFSLGM